MEKFKSSFFNVLLVGIFILGIIFRFNLYLHNNLFNDDECRLALTMFNTNIKDMFLPIGLAQFAPPIFMFFSRIMAGISNFNEYFLKFIPFLSGVITLFMFYKVSEKYYNNKLCRIIGLYFIAISTPLIFFSDIFKQYSLEVLFTLICIYYLPELEINNLTKKQILILTVVICCLPLISITSVYFIGAFFAVNIFNSIRKRVQYKKILTVLIPFCIISIIYYFVVLHPSSTEMKLYYGELWQAGYINDLSSLFIILAKNLNFYFCPNKLVLFHIILLFLGISSMFIDNTPTKKYTIHMSLVLLFVLFASYFHLYPFWQRVSLFLSPLFLLLILKPLDITEGKNKNIFIISILFAFIGFHNYFSITHLKTIADINSHIHYSPVKLLNIIKERFNNEVDVVLFNSASDSSYLFYSYKNKFNTKNAYEIPYQPVPKVAIEEFLNSLNKQNGYWFYLVKEFAYTPERKYVLDWVEQQSYAYKIKDRDSYLYYIKPNSIK